MSLRRILTSIHFCKYVGCTVWLGAFRDCDGKKPGDILLVPMVCYGQNDLKLPRLPYNGRADV